MASSQTKGSRLRGLRLRTKVGFIVLFATAATFSAYFVPAYLAIDQEVEARLAKPLEHIASSAASLIDPKKHETILQNYLNQNPKTSALPEFIEIQSVLTNLQKANELSADIYTVIRPDWRRELMIFITMSNEKPYVGNGVPVDPKAALAIDRERPTHTHFYEDRSGKWISAFAPLLDEHGRVVAAVGVDYQADQDLARAHEQFLGHLILPLASSLLFALLFAGGAGSWLMGPIHDLVGEMQKVSDGNFDASIKVNSRDELGVISSHFNEMMGNLNQMRGKLEERVLGLEEGLKKRSKEIHDLKPVTQVVLKNISQGFFVFDRQLRCLPWHSLAAETMFGNPISNQFVWEVLGTDRVTTEETLNSLFEDPSHSAAKQALRFVNCNGKKIELTFAAAEIETAPIGHIFVIATQVDRGGSEFIVTDRSADNIEGNREHTKLRGATREFDQETLFEFSKFLASNPSPQDIFQRFTEHFVCAPISSEFISFQVAVKRMADAKGKKISFQFENGEIPILPGSLGEVTGGLSPIFRNIVEHGIEMPGQRERNGKSAEGTIKVSFEKFTVEESGSPWIRLVIEDDGAGIDPQSLRTRLQLPLNDATNLSPYDLLQKVFSLEEITPPAADEALSPGHGLSVVKQVIEKRGGVIEVESELGRYTKFNLIFPLVASPPSERIPSPFSPEPIKDAA